MCVGVCVQVCEESRAFLSKLLNHSTGNGGNLVRCYPETICKCNFNQSRLRLTWKQLPSPFMYFGFNFNNNFRRRTNNRFKNSWCVTLHFSLIFLINHKYPPPLLSPLALSPHLKKESFTAAPCN